MSCAVERLKGSIPPLVTPFHNGEVDYDTYARLVAIPDQEWLARHPRQRHDRGAVDAHRSRSAIGSWMSRCRSRRNASRWSRRPARSRCSRPRQLTEHAAKAGADSLLIVTPYYIRPPQRGLIAYYLELASISQLPWMVYHIPGRAAVSVTLDTLKELRGEVADFRRHEARGERSRLRLGVRGCVRRRFQDLRRTRRAELSDDGGRRLRVDECGRQSAAAGARRICARRCGATTWRRRRLCISQLFEINQAVFFDTNPIPMKYMMKRLGLLPANEHRLPMVPATPELERRLDAVLRARRTARGARGLKLLNFRVERPESVGALGAARHRRSRRAAWDVK